MRNSKIEAHKKLKTYKNNKWIKDYSDAALEQVNDELDYVYIDGNHKYEYVKEDQGRYYKIVKPGGVIAGRDFNPSWPGVIQAVTEFADEKDIEYHLEYRRSDWYMFK